MKFTLRRLTIVMLAAVILLLSPIASAWDACGHKTVAAIALARLTPAVRARVEAIFQSDPRHRHFIDAATWPDDIKQGHNNDLPEQAPLDKEWHFIDITYDQPPDKIDEVIENGKQTVDPAQPASANVVTAIRYFRDKLKAGGGTAVEKADAMSWLIHLTGDIHQPLHCVTVTGKLPNYTPPVKGDMGGNGFAIHHPSRELHALWDSMFDEPTSSRHDEGRDRTDANAEALAVKISAANHSEAADLAKKEPADWAKESFALREFLYSPAIDPDSKAASPAHRVTEEYLTKARSIAEQRVLLAGQRLAVTLEDIYGDH